MIKQIVYVYGNGESRKGWDINRDSYHGQQIEGVTTWGCNAIYRDGVVDNLVCVDYSMQQEIYESGYPLENTCWFLDWDILPPEFSGLEVFREQHKVIHENTPILSSSVGGLARIPNVGCVVNGKDDGDLYITWITSENRICDIPYPKDWSSGTTAVHLACQQGATELFLLGFDLSINNIYEGTKNYPKQVEHPEWKLQLMTTFKEFKGTKFYWVEPQHSPVDDDTLENLKYITYVNIRRNICL